MKTTLIFSIIGLLILTSWKYESGNELKKLEWLIGTWINKTPKGDIYETWTKKSSSEFQGKSYYLKEKDTVILESVQLVEKEQKLYYIVSVSGQNKELPVSFASNKNPDPSHLIFENLQHDFPQIISYKKISADALIAEISATKNGKIKKMTFPMQRMK
ncbi:DUF6265 family protein [Chryseobacterium paridis]|uniref:DUF6265 domain-containing protein n=1 Tax=Chryseobacterium paridis TaxID=2800328 RepID=A0ABS1FWP7_9FLAO|nr:DUF6265 family protein [Chryseobacterium paridis]MBK1896758.1 hypothetical protein [Chryseobacterium paridis]